MNKEQLDALIKLVLDRNFEYKDWSGWGDYHYECKKKDTLQQDLVETLSIFLDNK